MPKVVVIRVGKEITGVYISAAVVNGPDARIDTEVINFESVLAPWEEKTLEQIEQSKLVKIA